MADPSRPVRALARWAPLALGGLLLLPEPVLAQAQGDGFLFGRPRVALGFQLGLAAPLLGGDVFADTRDLLTLERSDFLTVAVGGELAVRLTERLDVALGVQYSGSEAPSEYHHWVGTDDLPIRQVTRFVRIPTTVSAKLYLMDRGRTLSRFAWVPAPWSPYLGAGGGAMWWRLEQTGEFVNFETLDILPGLIEDEGFAPTAHVLAGVMFSLGARVALNGEARYVWGSAEPDPDVFGCSAEFGCFEEIDLSGLQATVGLAIRF